MPSGRRQPHHWKMTTFIGALRLSGMTAPMLLEGPMTGAWFLAYVQQMLAPALQRGDVVILDNLSAHKITAVRQAVEATGAELLFLPPYSPEFNLLRAPSPGSRRSSARRQPAPRTSSGPRSPAPLTPSNQPNATTTLQPPATMHGDRMLI